MTTIFTDDFAYAGLSIEIGEEPFGEMGRELILTTDNDREFRVKLSDEQLHDLADALLVSGYCQRNTLDQ